MADDAVRARIAELAAEIYPSARSEAYRVWQRAPHALEMDELMSLALYGLASAAHRWPEYCRAKGHDPTAYQFFRAYALRRMRGSMLDHLRAQDWVTRSARTKAKELQRAGADRGLSDAELAAATGMDISEVREVNAAVAARPVSIDAERFDAAAEDDVEGQAVVSQVLAAVSVAAAALHEEQRLLLALRYYHGIPVAEAAAYAGVTPDEASQLHQDAILEIHSAMLRVVA